jgi:hypothetical protein
LGEEDEELGKYNLSKDHVEYEIGQRIIAMRTIKTNSRNVATNIKQKL